MEKTLELVRNKIESDHKIGHQAGGSGHSAFTSYSLHRLKIHSSHNNPLVITYWYTIYVETEFTYYPDNPPHEYHYCKAFLVDKTNAIIGEEQLNCKEEPDNITWLKSIDETTKHLEGILQKIEWNYGENRAPFKYPPIFIEKVEENVSSYICAIEEDLSPEKQLYYIESNEASQLLEKVKSEITSRYNI